MKSPLRSVLFAALSLVLLAGCKPGAGSVPADLEGSWYAGEGGTTVPYDPNTGEWGTPSGQGLVYVFHGDGSYTKAYQSYNSAGGCTNGFTSFDDGDVTLDGAGIVLTPSSSHTKVSDSCAPSLDSDDPNDNLADERFDYAVSGDALTLTRSDGASAVFQRLQ